MPHAAIVFLASLLLMYCKAYRIFRLVHAFSSRPFMIYTKGLGTLRVYGPGQFRGTWKASTIQCFHSLRGRMMSELFSPPMQPSIFGLLASVHRGFGAR